MVMLIGLIALVAGPVLAGTPAAAADGDIPAGWFKAGSHPAEYDMGLDTATRHEGRASAFIRSRAAEPQGFGTLMQTAEAGEYRGKRVRFSGYVKSEKVDNGWSGLWLRVDGPQDSKTGSPVLSFDNMQERPIKGTQDWRKCDIVLDVPVESLTLNFGLLLRGGGQVWMDSLRFEVVSNDVPVTRETRPLVAPQNLEFDKSSPDAPKK